jgi:hypothetical protein
MAVCAGCQRVIQGDVCSKCKPVDYKVARKWRKHNGEAPVNLHRADPATRDHTPKPWPKFDKDAEDPAEKLAPTRG